MSLTRRVLLLAGVSAAALAGPDAGAAERRPPRPHGRSGAPAAPVITGSPGTTPLGPFDTPARFAFIMDYTTGATLLDKDADTPMTPSSMTKLMTLYIVYSQIKAGKLSLTQGMPVSEKAWKMGGSKMFVPLGGTVAVEDLIRGIFVASGNDACIVLAEGIAGSEEQFVEMMNKKAKDIGLTHSTFKDATGWPDPGHLMSARDIGTLAMRLIRDFPEYYHYASEKSFKFNNIEQQNRNILVDRGVADGLKTGHTDDGGFGEVASAIRNDRRVIVVINGLTTMHARAEESERLLEWAFANFEDVRLFSAGDVVDHAPVWLGSSPTVPLVGGRDLDVTMPRQWQSKAKISVEYQSPITAPVTRGTTVGRLLVSGPGVPDMEVPLMAGADIAKLGLPGRAVAVLSHLVSGG